MLRVKQFDKVNKLAFNFYFVTQMLQLNGLASSTQEASTNAPHAVSLQRATTLDSPPATVRAWFELGQDGPLAVALDGKGDEPGAKGPTLRLEIRPEILEMEVSELSAVFAPFLEGGDDVTSRGRNVRQVAINLLAAEPHWHNVEVPPAVARGACSMYKWYRKWELIQLALTKLGPIVCTLHGRTAPALMELFFAADVRRVSSAAALELVGFGGGRHGFMPGPCAMRHVAQFGKALVRQVVLGGVELASAVAIGLVTIHDPLEPIEPMCAGSGPAASADADADPKAAERSVVSVGEDEGGGWGVWSESTTELLRLLRLPSARPQLPPLPPPLALLTGRALSAFRTAREDAGGRHAHQHCAAPRECERERGVVPLASIVRSGLVFTARSLGGGPRALTARVAAPTVRPSAPLPRRHSSSISLGSKTRPLGRSSMQVTWRRALWPIASDSQREAPA